MDAFFKPIWRTAATRRAPFTAYPTPRSLLQNRPTSRRTTPILIRTVASSVSGRPGSQSVKHAATNIREEIGNSTTDWAKAIAAHTIPKDDVMPRKETFFGITSAVAQSVPKPYIGFGLLGGIPYVVTSGTVIYLARQAGLAATGIVTNLDPGVALTILDRALNVQVTYGAVMLSFLGAIHWGMEFAGYGGKHTYRRLTLGVMPILWGWPTLALQPTMALIVQWTAFTCLWWADLRATNAGWAPAWYSQYRFYLSILVGTCIIGTLASISFWGPVAGHGLLSHDLELIRAQRKSITPEGNGLVAGDVEAVSTGEHGDFYVAIRRKNGDGNGNGNGNEDANEKKEEQTNEE